ncbi:MAG TPA: adenylate/guanylate cyclase domain-containing protein [Nonomuraea sp.]|nr:adenylate/guanylate cyclase domain-containing protein [Nonomuraea sp.]
MLACARCGEQNPERARFCLHCGNALAASRPLERERRKIVTVVFCDVVGSVSLGEQLDPESLRRVMSRYFEGMRSAIVRHGGTVEKFIGDAVMSVFGVPESHEDDAVRALAAAAAMREELAQLNDELHGRWGVRLELRIGVDTGEVLARDPGPGQAMVTGDVVNTAARFQQAADPGQIVMGRTTFQLARDAIRAEPLEPLQLRGKQSAVPAFRLLEVSASSPGRRRRLHQPIVGRAGELAVLAAAYEDAARGRCSQLVTVIGEAGVGKTRLVTEALRSLAGRATVLMAACPEYGEGMTFWPVAETIRQAANLTVGTPQEQVLARLASMVGGDSDQSKVVAEHLAQLLGAGAQQASIDDLGWAFRKLLESVAHDAPLVLVFEDVHWAETSFLDIADQVVAWARQPMLVVCAGRPELLERRPWWGEPRTNMSVIRLEPLNEEESGLLLEHLLGSERVADTARAWVRAATEGNPLFVEETVAMLVDDGLLQEREGAWEPVAGFSTASLPPTIESLLMARIDQLGERDSDVLQRASVVGKVFGTAALAALAPEDREELSVCILRLVRRVLLDPEPTGFLGGEAFSFRHVLIRDAAYRMLTKEERSVLHERFAAWVERVAGEWAVEYEELLAYHLEAASHYRRAVGFLDEDGRLLAERAARLLAGIGRRALAREDAPAAVRLLTRARDLLSPGDVERAETLHDLGRALMAAGEFADAPEALDEAAAAAIESGNRLRAVDIDVTRLRLKLQTDPSVDFEAARREAQEAAAEFERLGDRGGMARALHLLAYIEWTCSHLAATEAALEQAVSHARAAGDVQEEEASLGDLTGLALFGPTPVDLAVARCEEVLSRPGRRRTLQARALRALAGLRGMQGQPDAARELASRSLAIFEDLGQSQFTPAVFQVLGFVERLAGDLVASEAAFRRSYDMLDKEGDTAHLATAAALLADALHDLGREEDAEHFTNLSETLGAADDAFVQMRWRAVRAKVRVGQGRIEEAVVLAKEAERLGRGTELHPFAEVLLDLAGVLDAAGLDKEAISAVEEAIALYLDKGDIAGAARARRTRDAVGQKAQDPAKPEHLDE